MHVSKSVKTVRWGIGRMKEGGRIGVKRERESELGGSEERERVRVTALLVYEYMVRESVCSTTAPQHHSTTAPQHHSSTAAPQHHTRSLLARSNTLNPIQSTTKVHLKA